MQHSLLTGIYLVAISYSIANLEVKGYTLHTIIIPNIFVCLQFLPSLLISSNCSWQKFPVAVHGPDCDHQTANLIIMGELLHVHVHTEVACIMAMKCLKLDCLRACSLPMHLSKKHRITDFLIQAHTQRGFHVA